jgi:hypothetical protein
MSQPPEVSQRYFARSRLAASAPLVILGREVRAWPFLFAGIAFLYLYFIPYFPALNNPNENSRVYQIRAAVELHKLSVNEQIARYGMVNDLARRDGLYYAAKAPATTFIGVPIYAALHAVEGARGRAEVSSFRLTYVLRLVGTLLPTLAFVVAFRRFLRRFVREEPVLNALAVMLALGSMLLPYALIYVNHSLSAASAFGAVIAAEAAARTRGGGAAGSGASTGLTRAGRVYMALAGFLLALSAALDYALLPVALMLLVYAVARVGLRPAPLAALSAGGLIPSIATAVYHTLCWGGPFQLSTKYLANPEFHGYVSKGLFGVVGLSGKALSALLVSPAKGILYLAPIFALGLAAAITAAVKGRSRGLGALCLVITAWMILYASSLVNWDAGWTVGPRYMTALVPFVFTGLALSWEALGDRTRAFVLPLGAGLGIVSVLVMSTTSVLFPHLPPEYKNPVAEVIWPLWRDGITPHSLGRHLFGLEGRADQIPFLAVLTAVLLYLVYVASGGFLSPRPSTSRRVASSAAAVAIAALLLGLGTIPRTEPARVVEAGTAWLRRSIWEPPLAKTQAQPRTR